MRTELDRFLGRSGLMSPETHQEIVSRTSALFGARLYVFCLESLANGSEPVRPDFEDPRIQRIVMDLVPYRPLDSLPVYKNGVDE